MTPELPYDALPSGTLEALTWQRGLTALAVLVGFTAAGRLIGYLVRRALSRRRKASGRVFAYSTLLTHFFALFGFVAAMRYMGVPLSSLVLTSGALLVGVGLSLQHVARDFVAGIILLTEQQIRKGDFVTFGTTIGTVQEIGVRSSHLITRDGTALIVPNHMLVSNEVVNHSHPGRRARLDVLLPVAYSADIDVVEGALLGAASDHPEVLSSPPPTVRLEEIDDLCFRFRLMAWIADPVAQLRVASELRFSVARELARRGIAFPTPELRLHRDGAEDARRHDTEGPDTPDAPDTR